MAEIIECPNCKARLMRATRVTDPFHKFAGVTKEIFVLEVF